MHSRNKIIAAALVKAYGSPTGEREGEVTNLSHDYENAMHLFGDYLLTLNRVFEDFKGETLLGFDIALGEFNASYPKSGTTVQQSVRLFMNIFAGTITMQPIVFSWAGSSCTEFGYEPSSDTKSRLLAEYTAQGVDVNPCMFNFTRCGADDLEPLNLYTSLLNIGADLRGDPVDVIRQEIEEQASTKG